jgi:hypothetical protein
MKTVVAIALLLMLGGCMSYAKVERSDGADKCRVVVRGYFFSFNNPSALEECRSDEDR